MAWDLTSYWSKDGTVGASRSMPRLRESPHFRSFVIRMSMTPRVCQAHPARSRTRTHETRQRQPCALSSLRDKRTRTRVRSCSWNCQLRHRREALGHVDATLRLLDPSIDIDQIPNKRLRKRIKLFRQGELGRSVVGMLCKSTPLIGTQDITSAILAAGGHGESAKPSLISRVQKGSQDRPWQGRAVADCVMPVGRY